MKISATRREHPVIVVGAGIGGLAAALSLAAAGQAVTVLEAADVPGGRMRVATPGGHAVDAGPTVMTLPHVFEGLFEALGERMDQHLTLDPLDVLARHAWADGSRLDLHADPERSRQAIAEFAGVRAGDQFARFVQTARALHEGLGARFMEAQRPGLLRFAAQLGPLQAWRLRAGTPTRSLWSALGDYFADPRLRQLFARYATYVGSSPYASPAVLMLIAQVEMAGVSAIRGGMTQLAHVLAALAQRHGVHIEYGQAVREIEVQHGRASAVICQDGTRHPAASVIFNGDPGALELGQLGPAVRSALPARRPRQGSLSALTYAWHARPTGFELAHHTVFFSDNYRREFTQIFDQGRLPEAPSVYVCAQDRGSRLDAGSTSAERLFAIINAPAPGTDATGQPSRGLHGGACAAARDAALRLLDTCGLRLDIEAEVETRPGDFANRFPGSGGSIYGAACHGWSAPFRRPGSRSALPGLYLAGGGVHPGPGVPMVAISGRLAAAAVVADLQGSQHTTATRRMTHPQPSGSPYRGRDSGALSN